jgi:hypothetical protein
MSPQPIFSLNASAPKFIHFGLLNSDIMSYNECYGPPLVQSANMLPCASYVSKVASYSKIN